MQSLKARENANKGYTKSSYNWIKPDSDMWLAVGGERTEFVGRGRKAGETHVAHVLYKLYEKAANCKDEYLSIYTIIYIKYGLNSKFRC